MITSIERLPLLPTEIDTLATVNVCLLNIFFYDRTVLIQISYFQKVTKFTIRIQVKGRKTLM